jgi:hypothetical protein
MLAYLETKQKFENLLVELGIVLAKLLQDPTCHSWSLIIEEDPSILDRGLAMCCCLRACTDGRVIF